MVRNKSINNSSELNISLSQLNKGVSFKKEINIFIVYIYIICAIGISILLPSEYLTTALYYSAVILCAVMLAALAESSKSTFFLNAFLGISFLVLFFNLGFRNYSGIDDPSYINIFYSVSQYGWVSSFQQIPREPGYLMLNAFVSIFTDNYLYMQLTTTFIPLFLFYRSFKKYRKIISMPMAVFLLTTMMYFFMLSVSTVRMFIAISIVFNAFYYIPKRNAVKYVLLILLAAMFHYSALFMLILTYFSLNKTNLSRKSRRFLIIGFVATPIAFIVVSKFASVVGGRYAGYGTITSLNLSLSSFDTLPLLLLLLLFYKRFNGEAQIYFKLLLTIYALSSILSFYSSMVSLGRLIFYANSAFFLAAPMVSKLLNKDSKKIIFHGIIILYGFFYLYKTQFIVESHIPHLFPYQNLFFTI